MWRPDGFDTEETARQIKSRCIKPNGTIDLIEAVDIVADAILEVLRHMGKHYSNLPLCCQIIYDVAWQGGSGTTIFIPDEIENGEDRISEQ